MPKQDLIEKALAHPREFTNEDFYALVNLTGEEELTFTDIRLMVGRIYSLNDARLLESSTGAFHPPLGTLNSISSYFRLRKFNRLVKNISPEKRINILAEGDSWFQLPVGVNDIIDWLYKLNPNNAIYSIAYGGNWITNIIYDGKYVAELPIVDPKFFLISGGGNDLVENNHLAVMVKNPAVQPTRPQPEDFITKEFFAFCITIKLQYFMMFRSIRKKYKDLTIITQGYDYALPSYSWRWSFRYPQQFFINWLSDSGGWLKRPFQIKGIPENMHAPIVKFFIDHINETYISLAQEPQFANICHIDCRGLAKSHNDWFDELHLKGKGFRKVAEVYQGFMSGTIKPDKRNVIEVNKQ